MGEMSDYHFYHDANALIEADMARERYQITPASTWVTREGRRVHIPHMEDRHLRNTIRFLRKRSDALMIRFLKETAGGRSVLAADASDAVDAEIMQTADGTDHDRCMYAYSKYRALYTEAVRRWGADTEAHLSKTSEQDR